MDKIEENLFENLRNKFVFMVYHKTLNILQKGLVSK